MIVPSIGTTMVALRLTCARLHFHVSGASKPRAASKASAGNATRRCRCLLRSAWVNIMPVRLLFVISGILAGGIPGFRIELCCFYHPIVVLVVQLVSRHSCR